MNPVQASYKFVKISKVTNLPAETVVDVLAWVKQVQSVENLRGRDGRDLRKREVWLVDKSAGNPSLLSHYGMTRPRLSSKRRR